VSLRLAPSVLAVAVCALGAAGAGEIAVDVLLVAVVVAAAAGLEAVASVVDGERSRVSAVLAGLGLLSLVAAGAMRMTELALGCLLCAVLDGLQVRVWVRQPIPE
jgi:hypothetical protein